MSSRRARNPGAKPKAVGGSVRGSRPRWEIHDPAFEADATCPLMPVWPWGGHRGWAYDLVRFMKPPVIAELGVHWGTSLFAFAQAVKDASLTSRMIGVDTWAGDEHTGPYGSEVLRTVRAIAADFFPSQDFELLQTTFDEALPRVADGSIDLLHIDGFHEYDAVAHDFESWLIKLAPDGVVILHDVAKSTGYGSARYWEDLVRKYPGFAFEHSWGLGVVFPKGDRWLKELERENLRDKVELYTYRARFQRATIELKDTGDMAVTRLEAMSTMEGLIRNRDGEIALLKQILADRDNEITLLKAAVGERDAGLQASAAQLTALGERLGGVEQSLREALEVAGQVQGLRDQLAADAARSAEAEAQSRARIDSLQRDIGELEALHRSVSEALDVERSRTTALVAQVAELSDERAIHLARLEEIQQRQVSATMSMQALMVRIQEQEAQARSQFGKMEELSAMNEHLKAELDKVAADLEMLAMRVEQLERLELEREADQARRSVKRPPATSGGGRGRRS